MAASRGLQAQAPPMRPRKALRALQLGLVKSEWALLCTCVGVTRLQLQAWSEPKDVVIKEGMERER